MINEKNVQLGKVRSSIREIFEYGKKRKAEIGEENVYDFSLGNPSIPAPKEVAEVLKEIIDEKDSVQVHGYTSAQGNFGVRQKIAEYTNARFNTALTADCIYMTCGAAASLTIILNALVNAGDEVLTLAPFFPEYRIFSEHAGAKFIPVMTKAETFQIDFDNLKAALSPKTKAVIINSPNNPSGVIYDEKSMILLGQLLKEHSKKYKNPVYLISDEPYRELVFENEQVPYVMNYYDRSIVCYSYSKSLSLPGERIGYIAVNNKMEEFSDLYAGVCGAGRVLGFVCAPALFQRLIERIYDKTSDISAYKRNRDRLYEILTGCGYTVVKPQGAFYMFVKALESDARAFVEKAKEYELLVVAGDDFGCKGYVRVSYCVSPQTIERSAPAFKALAESYKKARN